MFPLAFTVSGTTTLSLETASYGRGLQLLCESAGPQRDCSEKQVKW